jgi:chloride channel 2
LCSGVGSGKEGPMIHMSAMICYNIGYLPFYKDIIADPYRKKLLLNAAVACGVTSTFGAPYGAMIFSIELCSTVFLVSNLWKLFVTATVVKIMYDIGHTFSLVVNITSNFTWPPEQKWSNFPHFLMLGIICGWMASLWIFCFSQFLQIKAKLPWAFLKNRYFYV